MNASPLIGVDWGSTHLRAFKFDAQGAVVETRRAASGVSAAERDFESILANVVTDWVRSEQTRIVVCGSVGSREGWIEAPYVPCPCSLDMFARAMVRAPPAFADIWIAPGAMSAHENGRIDVLRGEETQILGVLEKEHAPALVIAPGTHSKWARIADGQLASLRTYMTGEMFALLKAQSILGRPMIANAPHAPAAFDLGVTRALEEGALLNLLFSVRTEALFARLAPNDLESYLSGVLIGGEICEALKQEALEAYTPILVISASTLSDRYRRALTLAGLNRARMIDGEAAAARGLWRLASARAAL